MGFGHNLRRLREARGWKQMKLAEKAGISQTHLSQIEREKIEAPHFSTIGSLMDALNVNPEKMIKETFNQMDEDVFLERCGVDG